MISGATTTRARAACWPRWATRSDYMPCWSTIASNRCEEKLPKAQVAASKGGGAWDELRPRISSEMARLGGTSDEKQGSFGTELLCMVPIQAPDGQAATQASRIVAHEGSAWLLRATLMGPVALDSELAAPFEETIRQVVVRRGRDAMPPGAPLRLTLPHDAQPVVAPETEPGT